MKIFRIFKTSTAAFHAICAFAHYYAAMLDLRAREAHLQGLCDSMMHTTDVVTRADMALEIKHLSAHLVEARNRVISLRPGRQQHNSWRTA